ncbi:MAG: ABC-type transport auxiliary lipoprotein family protein [Aliarcobacter sp.]|jgi:cholesterol transport system auxiliary component|nr:ABC-type transport auxiliary lipoprotein family protein [Aliarcobacter sp.]
MKNSMKIFIYICIIGLFSACSFKQDSMDINTYAIDFKTSDNFKINKKTIYVETPDVNQSFNSKSIFYTTKSYLFEEYALNKWIDNPSSMIHNNLALALEDSHIYKTVLKEKSKIKFDYMLKTEVISLYNSIEETNSFAVLSIKFNLVSNDEVVKTYTYNKKVLCQNNKPYDFVIAVNKAFEEVVSDLTLELHQIK